MPTFIFGHKNPDTDSVCSSIALSYIKNELGEKTIPKVLGNINNETKFVLNYFKVPVPSYLNDVRVRIKNIKFDKKAIINENESIDNAFKLMQERNVTALPLVDDNKILTGYVTLKELARYLITGSKELIDTTLDNIIDSLQANIVTKYDENIKGNVLVAGMKSNDFFDTISLTHDDILIVGDRYKILDYAIESKVKLIILPLNSTINNKLLKKAMKNNINIIETSMASYEISSKILLANKIKNIEVNHSPITVNLEDYYSDFKTMTHQINHTNYPVVNNKGECVGLIRLTGPNEYDKQSVILVDHNNLAQSVDGIEEAEILQIIDHHNLGAIGTSIPINFRSKPVGCTSTIIYDLYLDYKVNIPQDIAGLMLSAILSDTLLLTSPTTTDQDRNAAEKLARIAKVDMESYGLEMLKAASSIKGMSVDEIIMNDFKTYNVNSKTLGIAQIMTMDFDFIEDHLDEFVEKLNELVAGDYSIVVVFITDIIKNGSYVLYNDNAATIVKEAYGIKNLEQGTFLPKMVSRKKQMLPSIMSVLDTNNI